MATEAEQVQQYLQRHAPRWGLRGPVGQEVVTVQDGDSEPIEVTPEVAMVIRERYENLLLLERIRVGVGE